MELIKKIKKLLIFVFINVLGCYSFSIEPCSLINEITKYLRSLKDSPTGAIDSEGNYTKNSNNGLNCSGFAKWIVDGFYSPLCEDGEPQYISVRTLRKKHPGQRGATNVLVYENSRDPYFGLDWTRNLAFELGKKRGENPSYMRYDVTDSTVEEYVTNCGYPLSRIEDVLKEQAVMHPNFMYLGSINGYFGKNPTLWQHYHIAVFIPYYENNVLRIAVFERNKETSFSYLLKRYPNTFCHLVAISTEGEFELMKP